ncbi:MAG: sigma-54 dependent transcriptional regulator [Melioribacteraceae bacterium]|nr:sigma-54 dependent transcriptional regulator [Melioribacteraceae bacterium]MCF8263696.1 sigma-54 dependent transcriptional regulator [Melioribacteraceae bacterium]MCF8414216.1 sigma-54 dependent transcriptional regulator [Melioribacteraceae bacterium]
MNFFKNDRAKILIADDDKVLCDLLQDELSHDGYNVETVLDGSEAIESIKNKPYDIILLDLEMRRIQGEDVLKYVRENKPSLQVIVLTGKTDIRTAVDCMKLGAYDFVTKPYEYDQLMVIIERAVKHRELMVRNAILQSKVEQINPGDMIGESKALKGLLNLGIRAAAADSNILIQGETGTGKELFAEFIHNHSGRKPKPFITVNCASLPDQLIESELFGHEKGAFTDAKSGKQGLVEIANDGSLFLDEIGELSLTIQPKLLRFLEKGEFRRVGGIQNLRSNVRIIAATNRNLEDEVQANTFRRDLLYRLNVITLTLPPLRERREDIPLLAEYFLKKKSPVRSPKKLSGQSKEVLISYDYPGNIRELQHIIERAIIFSNSDTIEVENLNLPNTPISIQTSSQTESYIPSNIVKIEDIERIHYKKVLDQFEWNRENSARALGVSQKTLYSKIKKYDLSQYE